MHPTGLIIEPLREVRSLADLAANASADRRRMVARLIEDWEQGRNRFDLPGERAYVAKLNDQVRGVCGLNRDPFAQDATVGRVRRLYVAVQHRRQGIGTALVMRLLQDARGVFDWMDLRTHDPPAAAFYEAIGFERVAGNAECTHRRRVLV